MPRNAVLSVGYLWGRVRDAYLWDFCGARQRSPAAHRAVASRVGHDVVVAAVNVDAAGADAVAGELLRGSGRSVPSGLARLRCG